MKRACLLLVFFGFLLSLEGALEVSATIFPLYDLVRNIGGDKVKVNCLLPPGANPHLFEFTPGQLKKLKNVRIIFSIGHGVDEWVMKIKDTLPHAKMIIVDEGIPLIPVKGKGKVSYNPHYWLSIPCAIKICENIKNALIVEDPQNEKIYKKNFKEYIEKLITLHKELKEKISHLKFRKLITFHDAWPYFAHAFDLEILDTFEPSGAGEPSPRHLQELMEKIKKYNIKVIFVEPQLSSSILDGVVESLSLKTIILDPLGGVEGRETYIKLMKFNVTQVLKGLQNE